MTTTHYQSVSTHLARFGLLVLLVMVLTSCANTSPRIVIEPSSQELGERPQQFIELSYIVRNLGTAR